MLFDKAGEVCPKVVLGLPDSEDENEKKLWHRFTESIVHRSRDVFELEYLLANYLRPGVRAVVFFLLVLGFVVTLLPTLITTILVVASLFSALTPQA